jgi:hypothetical protein
VLIALCIVAALLIWAVVAYRHERNKAEAAVKQHAARLQAAESESQEARAEVKRLRRVLKRLQDSLGAERHRTKLVKIEYEGFRKGVDEGGRQWREDAAKLWHERLGEGWEERLPTYEVVPNSEGEPEWRQVDSTTTEEEPEGPPSRSVG